MPEILRNRSASLSVELSGGAITDFHLLKGKINPLQFSFTTEQMPENNKSGAPYQGHFLCLGQWGEPSDGEIRAGIPNHGHFANILWEKIVSNNKLVLEMGVKSKMEGLAVHRKIKMEPQNPVFSVEETISNINSIGRLYNIVQHPTIAFPFLDEQTIVDCNGGKGYNQEFFNSAEKSVTHWPFGKSSGESLVNLRNPKNAANAIYSYVIKPDEELGWVTCFSPKYKILIGYLWKRQDFPWLHFWLDWKDGKLQYRGLEFGTAGIHQPFRNIIETPILFDERTLVYIDAGEKTKYSYQSFLTEVEDGFDGVGKVERKDGQIIIRSRNDKQKITFSGIGNSPL